MVLERRALAAALESKGFAVDTGGQRRDHDVYRLQHQPLEPVWTKLSRGTKYKTLGRGLVGKIKRQLKLSNKQLEAFVECPMSRDDYLKHLRRLGILPPGS